MINRFTATLDISSAIIVKCIAVITQSITDNEIINAIIDKLITVINKSLATFVQCIAISRVVFMYNTIYIATLQLYNILYSIIYISYQSIKYLSNNILMSI